MYLENRLIAMLDILGFANKIDSKDKLEKITKQYSDIIEQTKEEVFINTGTSGPIENFEVGEFVFDNLIFVSKPLTEHASATKFIASITRIMEKFFELEYPLRGAIGIGDYSYNNNIFLSNIFKKLNKCEIVQQWSGCILVPEQEDDILKLIIGNSDKAKNEKSSYLHNYDIPLKSNETLNGMCINWSYNIKPEILESKIKYFEGDKSKHYNTQQYIDFCKDLEDIVQCITQSDGTKLYMKIRKTISAANIIFEDENGIPTNPIDNIDIKFLSN